MNSKVYGAQYGAARNTPRPSQNMSQTQSGQTRESTTGSTGQTNQRLSQEQLQQLLQKLMSLLSQLQGQQQGAGQQAGNTAQPTQTAGAQGGGQTPAAQTGGTQGGATNATDNSGTSTGGQRCHKGGKKQAYQGSGGAQQPPGQNTPTTRQPEQQQPEQKQPEQKQPEQKQPEQKQPEQKQPEQKQPEQRRETEETTRETANMGTGAFSGRNEQLSSWNQAVASGKTEEWDNKHWSDIAKHAPGGTATVKEENGKRYIHVAPDSNVNSRWVKEHGPSKNNPEGLPIKISPVAIDLNQNGQIDVTGQSTAKDAKHSELGRTVNFDLDGDGAKEQVEWLKGTGDGMLVDNRDGNAAEDMSGARLFGDQGGTFNNGYEKMQRLDQNQDGVLNGNELEGLEVWVDDGDAVVEAGEMKSLADVGITELSARHSDVQNERGETLMQADASRADGSTLLTEDVWFGKQA